MRKRLFFLLFGLQCMTSFSQVIENPVFDYGDQQSLHIDKIEITPDTTFVYCTYSAEANSWANILGETYLLSHPSNKKHKLLSSSGLPIAPKKRDFLYDERIEVLFCFSSIVGSDYFDFIERSDDNSFNIYGVSLKNQYEKQYLESDLKRFANMSDFYQSSGDINKYVEFEKKELAAAQYIYGKRSVVSDVCYRQLAYYYNEVGEFSKAIDMGLQALECDSIQYGVENKEYPLYANSLESLSLFYSSSGNETKSLEYVQKSLRIRRKIEDEKGYLNALLGLTLTGYSNDGIRKRIAIVKKEIESLPNFIGTNSLQLVAIYNQMASMYSLLNDNLNAIEYCNKALHVMDGNKIDHSTEYADLLGLKCRFQLRSGIEDEAILSGEHAKQLYESLAVRSLKFAELLGDLAMAYGYTLNYEKSVQLLTSAAEIYRDSKDWISLAEIYGNIGHFFQSAEKLDDAEHYIKNAIDVLDVHGNAEQYVREEVELTGNRMRNDAFTLATIKQRIETNKSGFYQTLARINQKQGKFADAICRELESGKIIKDMGDNRMYALHLTNLSEYYWRNNQQSEAFVCLEDGIKQLKDDSRISLALPTLQLAYMFFQAGDTVKAIHYAEDAVNLSKSINDSEIRIATQSMLSILYWKNHNYQKAEITIADALDYLKSFIVDEMTGMTVEQKQRLWAKYEHNYLLYRNIIEKSDRNSTLLSKLYDYILFSKSLLLDTEIMKDANIISRFNIKWNDIQQHLTNDAIAIEFISTMEEEENFNTYHALIVDKKSPSPRMITLYSESTLEENLKTETRNNLDIVGELIWKPILAQYTTVKDIYFSPDGILHLLPIEYYSADGTNSMSDHYNMYRLSSTKELIWETDKRHPNSAVLYGGLDYNRSLQKTTGNNSNEKPSIWRGIAERGGFDPLFNTALETQEIKDLLTGKNISTTFYSGETGTEESFRNLSGRSHSIIHLATHGMYIKPDGVDTKKKENNFDFLESLANVNDPVKEDVALTHSFLVMAGGNRLISRDSVKDKDNDGILTSKEISHLNLKGLDLVVLSACESALGDLNNDGVYGLQRGFKKAGANTILMSLNKVDDEATKILMVEFYRNLMSGKTKHQSLKDAQKYLRQVDNGKYDKPEYWASFIMLDGLN